MHDDYRARVLQSAVREHEICVLFSLLRSIGIEPVLLKGWSVGRHYSDPGVRALGDIDLAVRDSDFEAAQGASRELNVDWHKLSCLASEFPFPEELFGRSEVVPLLDTHVRVPCHEHNLRFVTIHMLRHGGWLPRWVADIGVLLKTRPSSFDWDLCLGNDPIRAWVLSGLVLAHDLAGADLRGTPAEHFTIPEWARAAVRNAQQNPDPADNQPPESIWAGLSHPWRLPNGMRKRWPNPITAAVMTGAAFERRRPFFHQLRYCGKLTGSFLRRSYSPAAH